MVPTDLILPTRARIQGILNANVLMKEAYRGAKCRRHAITISRFYCKQTHYICLDGNSTLINAKINGWKQIPAKIVPFLKSGL